MEISAPSLFILTNHNLEIRTMNDLSHVVKSFEGIEWYSQSQEGQYLLTYKQGLLSLFQKEKLLVAIQSEE